VLIHEQCEFLSGLKSRHVLCRNVDQIASFWIAPGTRRMTVQAKRAEPTNFNARSTGNRLAHGIKDRLGGQFDVPAIELRKALRDSADEFGASHNDYFTNVPIAGEDFAFVT
jgi:hypothetical protein